VTRYRWTGAGDRFEPADQPGQVRIIDSWLVADGQVRAFEAHTRRFSAACAELFGIATEQTREFMRAVAARLPAEGRWFPRAELAGAGADGTPRLQLWIRPAPAPGRTVRLWLTDAPDTRTYPQIKGPDLGWLGGQRDAAVAAGADEAVLLSRDGRVLEGSTTSIMWWHDDKLCAPGHGALPSITQSLLLAAAIAGGVTVAFGRPQPAELAGLEVWAVNALHGIRPVTAWVGTDIEPGPALRAARWQRHLDELAAPVMTDLGKETADVGSAVPAPKPSTGP
jgi:branched-subunit amino acid aminotransferase/4-amino-4-deoxychorismate lyase